MNISRDSTCLLNVPYIPLLLFLAVGLAPFIASWLTGLSSVTERTSDDQRFGSLDDAFLLQRYSE